MKNKAGVLLRRALLTLIVLAALAVLGFVLARAFGRGAETASVELAPPRTDENAEESAAPFLPQAADVTPETVEAVLRSIPAARSYSRAVMADTFWEGGSATELLLCWVRGDSLRLKSEERNLLSTPDGLWVWYDDAPEVFSAAAARAEQTRCMRLLDWETLLSEPDAEIVAASYTEFEGERCVYVSVRGGAFGYVSELYVSLQTGLLIAADSYEGEKCVYRMRSGGLELSTPDESMFAPPVAS